MGNQSFQNPPHPGTIIPSTKRSQLGHYPQIPPIEAYIISTEQAANKVPPKKQMNLGQMSTGSLNKHIYSTTNTATLTPQHKALTELKQDQSRVVLTADKGVAMVIMDQQDYTNKAQTLLQDTNTYKVLPKDPTSYLKNKLITLLKDMKQTGGLSTQKYKQLYPTSAVPHKFYGLPKIHKTGTPLDPLFPVGGQSPMGLPRSFPISSNP